MNFNEATELVNRNLHLIGQQYRGATIEELIIRPINQNEFAAFSNTYLRTFDANLSIQPFLESDLTVDVVCDRDRIRVQNVFVRTEIGNLLDENLVVNF